MKYSFFISLFNLLIISLLPAENAKPNIVFIMADDLGVGWVDYDDSNPEINTPNLQRLAETGMVFTRAYAACSVCSPMRGRLYHWHVSGADRDDDSHSRQGRQ